MTFQARSASRVGLVSYALPPQDSISEFFPSVQVVVKLWKEAVAFTTGVLNVSSLHPFFSVSPRPTTGYFIWKTPWIPLGM